MLKTGGTLHTPVKSVRHVQKERLVRAGIGRIFGNTSFFGGKGAIKNRKNEIMDDILDIVKRGDRGASSSADDKKAMLEMFSELRTISETEELNPKLLDGTWRLIWTTEKEILFIIKEGGMAEFFGTKAGDVFQVIDLKEGRLQNCIEFPPDGSFVVDSVIEYDPESTRCSFEFQGARLNLPSRSIPLPPVGKSTFRTLFVSNTHRIAEDARGDFLVIERVGPPKSF